MSDLKKRTATEIGAEIERLTADLQKFEVDHCGTREDVHAAIDARRTEARRMAAAEAARLDAEALAGGMLILPGGGLPNHKDLHALWALAEDDGYWQAIHDRADAIREEEIYTIPRDKYVIQTALLAAHIDGLKGELHRRRKAADEAAELAGMAK